MARSATTSDVFNAIAEVRRREIVGLLAGRELSVNDLVASIDDLTQPQVSKHLRVLREVGLVNVRHEGRLRWYSLDADQLQPIYEWVQTFERYWDHQLSSVKKLAEAKAKAPEKSASPNKKSQT